jgi:hypothetical protein
MPRLAAFPKAYMKALCRGWSMHLSEWIDMACNLTLMDSSGTRFFRNEEMKKTGRFSNGSRETEGKQIPMLCCSPDFHTPRQKFS